MKPYMLIKIWVAMNAQSIAAEIFGVAWELGSLGVAFVVHFPTNKLTKVQKGYYKDSVNTNGCLNQDSIP